MAQPHGQDPVTRRVIPNSIAGALEAVKAILARVRACGYNDAEHFAVRLALDEAISNAIRHGNKNQPDRQLTIEYEVDDRCVCVSVADEGEGFEPRQIPDPTLDRHLERPHGRGVMLMKAYMDEVRFNEQGNCVTLVKRHGGADAARAGTET